MMPRVAAKGLRRKPRQSDRHFKWACRSSTNWDMAFFKKNWIFEKMWRYRQITYYRPSLLIPSRVSESFRILYFTYLTKYLNFVKTVFHGIIFGIFYFWIEFYVYKRLFWVLESAVGHDGIDFWKMQKS